MAIKWAKGMSKEAFIRLQLHGSVMTREDGSIVEGFEPGPELAEGRRAAYAELQALVMDRPSPFAPADRGTDE